MSSLAFNSSIAGQQTQTIGNKTSKTKRSPPALELSKTKPLSAIPSKLEVAFFRDQAPPSSITFDASSLYPEAGPSTGSSLPSVYYDCDSDSDSEASSDTDDENTQFVYLPSDSPFFNHPIRPLSHSLKFDVDTLDAGMSFACDALADGTLCTKVSGEEKEKIVMSGIISLKLPFHSRDVPDVPLDWDDDSDEDCSDEEIFTPQATPLNSSKSWMTTSSFGRHLVAPCEVNDRSAFANFFSAGFFSTRREIAH